MKRVKYLTAVTLLAVGLLLSGFSVVNLKDYVYTRLKDEITKQVSRLLEREVSIESVQGILLYRAELHNVKIAKEKKLQDGAVISAEKIVVTYNPAQLLINKINILPVISHIEINGLTAEIIREKNGELNLAKLLPQKKETAAKEPLPFYAKISIKSGNLKFLDYAGFGRWSRAAPFTTAVEEIKAELNFKPKGQLFLSATAVTHTNQTVAPVAIAGSIDLTSAKYKFNARVQNLALNQWAGYILPIRGFKVNDGAVDLSLDFASANNHHPLPVTLQGTAVLHHAAVTLFDYPLHNVEGNLSLTEDSVTFDNLKLVYKTVPARLSGKLYNFASLTLDCQVTSDGNLNLATLPAAIDSIKTVQLAGLGNFSVNIKGPATHPTVTGSIACRSGNLFGRRFSGKGLISFINQTLSINIADLNLCGGKVSGPLSYTLDKTNGKLNGTFTLTNINLSEIAGSANGLAGNFSGKLLVNGRPNQLFVELAAESHQAEIMGQAIDSLYTKFEATPQEILLKVFDASSDKAVFQAAGTVSKDWSVKLNATAKNFCLKGESPVGILLANIEIFSGSLNFKLNQEFLNHPLYNLAANGAITLTRCQFGPQIIDHATGELMVKPGIINVNNFTAQAGRTTLTAAGTLGEEDSQLIIKTNRASLPDLKILNLFLSKNYRNPTGSASLTLTIDGKLPPHFSSPDAWQKLNYVFSGNLFNAKAHQIVVENAALDFAFKNQKMQDLQCSVKTTKSHFNLSLKNDDRLIVSGKGRTDLSELEMLALHLGQLEGYVNFDVEVSGTGQNPSVLAKFEANRFRYNSVNFDQIKGVISWQDLLLKLEVPVAAKIDRNQFVMSGDISFKKTAYGQILPDLANLTIKVESGDLNPIAHLTQNILDEINRLTHYAAVIPHEKAVISLGNFALPHPQTYTKNDTTNFYAIDKWGKPVRCFIKDFAAFLNPEDAAETATRFNWADNLGGETRGNIIISGPLGKLTIKTDNFTVKDGYFQEFKFSRLDLQAKYHNQAITLDQLLVEKDRGQLKAAGTVDLTSNKLNLKILASQFPTDSLKLIFPGGKNFEGKLNLDATVSGTLSSPQISAKAQASRLVAEEIPFEEVNIDIDLSPKQLTLNTCKLKCHGTPSFIAGFIPLAANDPINLTVSLEGNALGLINLITSEIKWKNGQSHTQLQISGTRNQMNVNGKIEIKEARAHVSALKSTLKEVNGTLTLTNSEGILSQLSAIWEGARTRERTNQLSLAGTLKINQLLAAAPNVFVNLQLADTELGIDLPDILSGDITLKNIKLAGPFYLSNKLFLQKGPKLSGEVTTKNCVFYLPKGGEKEKKMIYLDYDVVLSLLENNYASGGGGGDFTKIDLSPTINLEVFGENLVVKGNSREPSIAGELYFKSGTVNLFDREFTLISTKIQEKYYGLTREKINENAATFKGGSGSAAIIPELNLTAKVVVDNYVTDDAGEQTKEKVTVISHITGMPYVKDEQRGIKVSFDSFKEETGLTNIEKAGYSEDEVKAMLLPDFLKSALGTATTSDINSTEIMVNYLSGRAQNYFSSTLGRQIEKALGLESLILEYNVGRDLRRSLGTTSSDDEEEIWGVGFVKGFFDKFYIDLRYTEAVETQTQITKEYFNYELTYKLSKIWSIAYYCEPDNLNFDQLLNGDYKTTLKASFKF